MAQDKAPSTVAMIHNYAHVVVALNETRKGMNLELSETHHSAAAIDKTVKGLCELIDTLVGTQHRELVMTPAVHG